MIVNCLFVCLLQLDVVLWRGQCMLLRWLSGKEAWDGGPFGSSFGYTDFSEFTSHRQWFFYESLYFHGPIHSFFQASVHPFV